VQRTLPGHTASKRDKQCASSQLTYTLLVCSSRSYPTPFTGASYTVLPGSTTNTTHWTLTVLAKGVSSWGSTNLDPAGTVSLAYAQSARPPTEPANNATRFSIHNSRGKWTHDLKSAQIADFAELVEKASATPLTV
jgi:hypothetical protein